MYVVGPHIYGMEDPTLLGACCANRVVDRLPLSAGEDDSRCLHLTLRSVLKSLVSAVLGFSAPVTPLIDPAALIAREPGPVGSPGDEEGG
jgi:hypothetical protein